jgi:hypothetical protein
MGARSGLSLCVVCHCSISRLADLYHRRACPSGMVRSRMVWFCFAVEVLSLFDALILYLTFLRTSDRHAEADGHGCNDGGGIRNIIDWRDAHEHLVDGHDMVGRRISRRANIASRETPGAKCRRSSTAPIRTLSRSCRRTVYRGLNARS